MLPVRRPSPCCRSYRQKRWSRRVTKWGDHHRSGPFYLTAQGRHSAWIQYGLERLDSVLAFGNACTCQIRERHLWRGVSPLTRPPEQQDRLNLSFPAVQGWPGTRKGVSGRRCNLAASGCGVKFFLKYFLGESEKDMPYGMSPPFLSLTCCFYYVYPLFCSPRPSFKFLLPLMTSLNTSGCAKVVVSPSSSYSPAAILRSMRRIILPEHVLGRPSTN